MLLRGSKIQKPGVHLAFHLKYYNHNGNTIQKHEEKHKTKELSQNTEGAQ